MPPKNLAGNLVKQGMDAAGDTLRKAAAVPGAVVGNVVGTLNKGLAAGDRHGQRQKSTRSKKLSG